MKIILSFILSTILLLSCSKDSLEYQNDFENSYVAYQQFKKANNNSYRYKTYSSSWVGHTTEYTIEVMNGTITKRSFAYTIIGNTKRPEKGWTTEIAKSAFKSIGYSDEEISKLFNEYNMLSKLEWSENKQELGTKESPFNMWTLDQIYETAKKEWIIKRKDAQVFFESNNNGLISSAGYIPNGCQDDCFIGISIRSIEPIPVHFTP